MSPIYILFPTYEMVALCQWLLILDAYKNHL